MYNFIILTLLFLTSTNVDCYSQSGALLKEFNRVDSLLQTSNQVLGGENDFTLLYFDIISQREEGGDISQRADTLFRVAKALNNFFDGLKEVIETMDSSGTRMDIAEILFSDSDNRMKLETSIKTAISACYSNLIDKSKEKTLGSQLASLHKIINDSGWIEQYFYGTPTSGVVSILNKIQIDINKSIVTTMADIKDHL